MTGLNSYFLEIQDFLSSDECDEIIAMAKSGGLENSQTLWTESADEIIEDGDLHEVFERLDVDGDKSLDYFEVSDDRCLCHCKSFPRKKYNRSSFHTPHTEV